MYLKRLFDQDGKPTGKVKVLRGGRKQKFSQGLIDAAVQEGWMTVGKGKVVVHGEEGDVVYSITRVPGYYCCHCGEKLEGDPRINDGVEAAKRRQAHVTEKHSGVTSPDPENPAGYMGTHSIKGVKEVSNG